MTNDDQDDCESALRPLWLRARGADEDAYRAALEHIAQRLRACLQRRMQTLPDAVEDLLHETLLAPHLQRGTYEPAFPVSAWVTAIARYKLVDLWRRRGRREDLHEVLVVRHTPIFSCCRRLASDGRVVDARRGLAPTVRGALPSPRPVVLAVVGAMGVLGVFNLPGDTARALRRRDGALPASVPVDGTDDLSARTGWVAVGSAQSRTHPPAQCRFRRRVSRWRGWRSILCAGLLGSIGHFRGGVVHAGYRAHRTAGRTPGPARTALVNALLETHCGTGTVLRESPTACIAH